MMSTRSNIIVDDGHSRIQLYRHCDGYPEGVLPDFELAVPYAWPFPRFLAGDFAAAVVRAWKDKGGGNIFIDGLPKGWEMIHHDVEWVYVIKPKKKPKTNRGVRDTWTGEPLVEVFDWRNYWFDKANPSKVKPKPVVKVKLSKAKEAGLKWQDGK